MEWIEITVCTDREAVEAVANIFYDHGMNGVVIEDQGEVIANSEDNPWDYFDLPHSDSEEVLVKGYLPLTGDFANTMASIRSAIKRLPVFGLNVGSGSVSVSNVKEEDWANSWKVFYKTEKVGKHIVIKPSWEAYEPKGEDIVIELDPGMAFGTGTHPTTTMCLRSLEEYIRGGETVFDLGTGSGVLSIAAAKLGAVRVYATDKDPVAVEAAQENIKRNGLEGKIKIFQSETLELLPNGVDLVVANIIADVIIKLSKDIFQKMKSGGVFISSGIISHRFDDVKEGLITTGFAIKDILDEGEWVAIIARKDADGV